MGLQAEEAGGLVAGAHLSRLVPLSAVRPSDRERVGGKAAELGRLFQAGLPVPPGVVIPTEVFRGALEAGGLLELAGQVERDLTEAAALRGAIEQLDVAPAVSRGWISQAEALGGRVAVRSSGVGEDGVSRSFAGQHRTLLEVAPSDVPAAVLACWSSLYAEGALAYRASGPPPGGMAVVIQQMVEPECSGVMFTVNPMNGSWREMVVEAVWGLGEGLVSGHIAPHWYLLRRPRRLPGPLSRLAERVRLQVVEEDLPELVEQFVGQPGGDVVRAGTPDRLRRRRTLERPALRRLGRLGLRAERALGGPQDIEWVRDRDGAFRILQSRPITATGRARSTDAVLWTRRFIGERWPDPVTPMGWSLLEPILTWFIAYPRTQERHLGGGPALRLVHGRPYINATVFRHLAFKLPGAPAPRFMLELVPPEEEAQWRSRFAVAPDLAVYGSILQQTLWERRWERFRWNPITNPAEWSSYRARLEAALPQLREPVPDPQRAVARVEEQLGWVREYVGIHLCSLLFAHISLQLLESAVATWIPDKRGLVADLLSAAPDNLTVQTNQALYDLALQATGRDLTRLEEGAPAAEPFAGELRAFLDRFGHRAEASWELMAPRWRDHPSALVPLLRAQRDVSTSAPRERAAAQEARRERAVAELRGAVSGPLRLGLERLVAETRTYMLLRENQRFWFDHLLDSLQSTVRALGRHGVSMGWFDAPDDVACLTWPEVRELVQSPGETAGVRARIDRRRAVRAQDFEVEPPTFLLGDDPGIVTQTGRSRLQGTGISPGRVRGTVRIVRTLSEGRSLEPGDVMVAHAVDPAWTPLFLTASAVVLELGSVLSHGAVIAREYEIPAVVNIDDATRRLRDGQSVTVDGHRGVVWVHDEAGEVCQPES